jgi:membrane associated rhomboid family serine protease
VFVFLFLQGPSFSFSEDSVETKPIVEFGMVPYRVTHPGERCDLAFPDDETREQLVCQGTDEYERAQQEGVPTEKIDQAPAWVTLFTSMFMHGGWLHIIFNMLFLWIFGNNIEDSMGRGRYVIFYLLGGLAADGLQIAANTGGTAPTIGASGAVAAVLGAYALEYPRARVLTLVFIGLIFLVELPALLLLGIWFVLQFIPAIGQLALTDLGTGGGVAYFAHVGGFVFGVAAIKLFAKRRNPHYGQPKYPVY